LANLPRPGAPNSDSETDARSGLRLAHECGRAGKPPSHGRASTDLIVADDLSRALFDGESRFHPTLLALGVMRHVGVTHGRQFTGGVFAGVSMSVRTVGDDLSLFIGQHLRGEFFDAFRGNIYGSRKVGFAITFGSKRLHDFDRFFSVQLGFQVFGRDSVFHCDLHEIQ